MFWGKYDAYTVKRMPTMIRKWHIEFTLDNLKQLYGSSGSSGSSGDSKEISRNEARAMKEEREARNGGPR